MTILLTLGGVIFNGFEIPESIGVGGSQELIVHKLPGGARIIDAMGVDHRDLNWSGRFRGTNAEARARLLDSYRIGGQVLSLQWSTFLYQVLVKSFEAEYRQPYEISYSISCTVLADLSAPILTGIPLLDEIIGSDLGRALGLSGSLGVAAIATAVNTVQQSVNAVNTIKGAPASSVSAISSSVAAAEQVVGVTATGTTATLGAATPVTAGGSPSAMATGLTTQASSLAQLAQLAQLSSTLTVMGKNLAA